jgi:hypothetical protein
MDLEASFLRATGAIRQGRLIDEATDRHKDYCYRGEDFADHNAQIISYGLILDLRRGTLQIENICYPDIGIARQTADRFEYR